MLVKRDLVLIQRGRTNLNHAHACLMNPLLQIALDLGKGSLTSGRTLDSGHRDALERLGLLPLTTGQCRTKLPERRDREAFFVGHSDVLLSHLGPKLFRRLLPLAPHRFQLSQYQVPIRNQFPALGFLSGQKGLKVV